MMQTAFPGRVFSAGEYFCAQKYEKMSVDNCRAAKKFCCAAVLWGRKGKIKGIYR